MRIDVKRTTGLALVMGLLAVGVSVATPQATPAAAAPPLDPRPLVELVEQLDGPDGFVLSADSTTMYVFNAYGDGSIVDVASRQVTGSFPAIDNLLYSESRTLQAAGTEYALPVSGGYVLLTLATGAQELFELSPRAGETDPPGLAQVVVGADGAVTAISDRGEFLAIDGTTITASSTIHDPDAWPYPTGISADGSLYFTPSTHPSDPTEETIVVIDMRTGERVIDISTSAYPWLNPLAFDPSGASLWATTLNATGEEVLISIDLASGTETHSILTPSGLYATLVASIDQGWFAGGGNPGVGGSLATGAELGGRELGCCTSSMLRIPGEGDLIFYDVEMRQVGFVTAPQITDPLDVPITSLGDTAVFTSEGEGLAMSQTEEGADPLSPMGSIWQSSADGVTWTDLPGETAATLSVTATAESYPLEYRRHFRDPYWGAPPSSAAARMTGLGPVITRPDNLPDGSAGKTYPGEIITATGQPGMTWSSTDLPATLTLNPATGEVSGTTDTAGDFSFTVTVTDVFGTDSRLFNLHVANGAVVPPGPDPDPGEGITPPKPELPNTGSEQWLPLAAVGTALLVAGVAGVLASRRRSATR